MQLTALSLRTLTALALAISAATAHAEPLLSSWFTEIFSKYARIYTTDTNKLAGTSVTCLASPLGLM